MRWNKFNQNYFDNIDNKAKAFWLGFIFGNCSIEKRPTLTMTISKKNETIIKELSSVLDSSSNIRISKGCYTFGLCSNHFCNKIKEYGRIDKNNITFPKISKDFYYAFIAGFVKGNSSMFLTKNNKTLDIHGPLSFLQEIKSVLDIGGSTSGPTTYRHGCRLRYSGPNQITKLKKLGIL